MPTLALETLRRLTINFSQEQDREVKNQVINAVVRLYQDSQGERQARARSLLAYLLELCKFDMHYDLRDKGRLLSAVFFEESPLRILEKSKLLAVREEVSVLAEAPYLPNTVSRLLGRKVEGYSKLWDDFQSIEALRPFLTADTMSLREEEVVPSLVSILPPQTHYSSEDTPKIGDAGLKTRTPAASQQALQAFLDSSSGEEESEEEEDS